MGCFVLIRFNDNQPQCGCGTGRLRTEKWGWGEEGEPHVPKLVALIFLSTIFLSYMDVVRIQGLGFSGLQNGGNASFGSQPDKHGLFHAPLLEMGA